MNLDLLTVGYFSIDYIFKVNHIPAKGCTAIIEKGYGLKWHFGGCAPNIAVCASRLGLKTGVLGVLGGDELSATYVSHLLREGVYTAGVLRVKGAVAPVTYMFFDERGDCVTFYYPGISYEGVAPPKGLASSARALIVTVGNPQFNLRALKEAKEAKALVVAGLKSDIYSYPKAYVKKLVELSDMLVLNAQELNFILKVLSLPSREELLKKYSLTLVVTKGKEGSEVYAKDRTFSIPAVPPKKLESPVGAGDAYIGGLVTGLLKGYDEEEAAKIGAVVASYALESVGAQEALPTWKLVEARYEEFFGGRLGK